MNTLSLRLTELTLALSGAKDRLRIAVAEELGRAAGSALRDILTSGSNQALVPRRGYTQRDNWDDRRWDDSDPWGDDRDGYRSRYTDDESDDETTQTPPAGVPQPVVIGLGFWRWWLTRGSWRGALALGLAAGTTALLGGPVIRAVLVTLSAAAELLTPSPLSLDSRLEPR